MPKEFDQSTESRFWQAKALDVAEEIDGQWQLAGEFWIDMESGVRTDDWFDLDKVRRVLAICTEVIKDLHMED